MRGVDRNRSKERVQFPFAVFFDEGFRGAVELVQTEYADAVLRQLRTQMAIPAIIPSASGVSCTRFLPNCSCRPAVARNTPPLTPMSSPNTTTVGSCVISHVCARLMASIIVTLATIQWPLA